MKCKALRPIGSLVVFGILLFPIVTFGQKAVSHVRAVRLSYVSGTVGVKHPESSTWAKAQINTPLQEGFEISTAAHSYAEVEFENGSTARLGELSKLSLDQLAMDEDGNKLNGINFLQGYATFSFRPEHHDEYHVKVRATTLDPKGKSEFRADLGENKLRVEVFSGSVEVATPSETAKLGKDKVAEFDPQSKEVALNETHGIVQDSWDKWTSQRNTQAQLALVDQAVPASGPMYGWSDLDAYGEWGYFPGFGYGWSPFAAAGWAPYTMGMWSFYPNMGYTWIAGEPWGWLPYHYGSWNFDPGFGWFWMPGTMSAFSPALVNWYTGPGWTGWAPLGVSTIAGQRVVNSVPTALIQNGAAITPAAVKQLTTSAGTRVTVRPFEPGAGALLPGPRIEATAFAASSSRATHGSAPGSILAGVDANAEQALVGGRSAHEPLRVRMGTTLGGQVKVGGALGEFRGDAFKGHGASVMPAEFQAAESSHASGLGGAGLLPHGQQAAVSRARAGESGGPAMAGPSTQSAGPVGSGHSAASAAPAGGGHH